MIVLKSFVGATAPSGSDSKEHIGLVTGIIFCAVPLRKPSDGSKEVPHENRNMTENREHAHHLIDRLPETQLSALVGLLETIVDPAVSALRHAQIDDEPETDEEKQEVAEAREWLRLNGGRGIPHEEAMRRLGL